MDSHDEVLSPQFSELGTVRNGGKHVIKCAGVSKPCVRNEKSEIDNFFFSLYGMMDIFLTSN